MKIYFHDLKTLSILIVIAVIAISYGLFFYFQGITENQIRSSLFRQQELRQQESTKAIANHIGSDLASILSDLRVLAQWSGLQINGGDAGNLTQQIFTQINTDSQGNPAALIERLYVVDENGIILIDINAENDEGRDQNFEGSDLSSMEYFQDVKTTLEPVFSKGLMGLDGNHKIAISYPIVGEDGKFLGSVTAKASVATFFQHYGNIHDIQMQYLAVLDRDSVQLVHPVESLVGTPFFGDFTQEATGRNEALNNLVTRVLSGESGQAIYDFRNGERLTTGYPIYLAGQPTYFVFVITPTSAIYANVDDALASQRIETFSLLAGTTATIFVLIIFLAMWNSNLRDAVQAKTDQLVDANKQLSIANEQLIENYDQLHANEKMQREFINIAAHELRTPVQPIIGLSDVLLSQSADPESRVLLEAIRRNANRLYRLSSDILDVARVESKSMHLVKKEEDIVGILKLAIEEAKSQIIDNGIELVLQVKDESLKASVDNQRIHQVMSNLLDNSIKFTEQGRITVTAENKNDFVLVKVIDTGSGIDPDIFPRLFSKFASKSEKGTGLGLFLSKSIIEAHGGNIWAENNSDEKGATFTFSLPIATAATENDDRNIEPDGERE